MIIQRNHANTKRTNLKQHQKPIKASVAILAQARLWLERTLRATPQFYELALINVHLCTAKRGETTMALTSAKGRYTVCHRCINVHKDAWVYHSKLEQRPDCWHCHQPFPAQKKSKKAF